MVIGELYSDEDEFLDIQQIFDMQEAVVTDMVAYEEPELEYSLKKVPIGYSSDTMEVFYFDMSKSRRILILGSTGAGKSTLEAGLIDRFTKAGGVVSVFDLKGEFVTKNKPLQPKYANRVITNRQTGIQYPRYLLPTERPQGFNLNAYRPVFLQMMMQRMRGRARLPKNEKLCQFSIRDLEKPDWFIFFEQLIERNPRYYELVDMLWNKIERENVQTWEELHEVIDNYEDFDKNARKLLGRTLKVMEDNEIIGDKYDQPNIVQDILNGKMSIFDMKGMLNMPQSNSPALMYVNILLRKIYNAKATGKVKKSVHNMVVVSEVNKSCSRLGNSPSKQEFLKLLDLVRSERISMVYDTQDWKRIPATLIEQADYVFLPYNVDLENLSEIVRKILPQEYENPHDYKPKLAYWQRKMKKRKDGRRDWLLLDRHDKRKAFIIPVLPLSHLTEEGDDY